MASPWKQEGSANCTALDNPGWCQSDCCHREAAVCLEVCLEEAQAPMVGHWISAGSGLEEVVGLKRLDRLAERFKIGR